MISLNIKHKASRALLAVAILLSLSSIAACSRPPISPPSPTSHFSISNHCTFPIQYSFEMDEGDKKQLDASLSKLLLLEELKWGGAATTCGEKLPESDVIKSNPKDILLKDAKKRTLMPKTGEAFYMYDNDMDEALATEIRKSPYHLYPSTKITVWANGALFMVFDRDRLRAMQEPGRLSGYREVYIQLCPESKTPCPWEK